MGVKFFRQYNDIIYDLVDLLICIPNAYTFFDMPQNDWDCLSKSNKRKYTETLADDLFFALGVEKEFVIGSGKIVYNDLEHTLEVSNAESVIGIVNLI